jgi:CheY-like chemotaxis protein
MRTTSRAIAIGVRREEDPKEAVVYEQSQPAAGLAPARTPAEAQSFCFVVDDDAGICKVLSFTLRKLGFGTAEVATPAALDAKFAELTPALIFLDLGLGQSGALDVLPILARQGYRGPVQLMSGRSQSVLDEVVAAGEQQGLKMLPALMKPFRMGVVKDLVASLGLVTPAGAADSSAAPKSADA